MGNKLGRRRQVVDEKYTRPQGLYQHRHVDHKKLRKLILDSKLAPCYPGNENCTLDLDECPICFLYYPSLNRSRCCMKGICTECFLQMKPPHSTRPTQCPFCKTSNYAVEYRGMRTKEEKGMEQAEEQRVIEAKIKMRQQELLDEEERMLKRQEISSSSRTMTQGEVVYQDVSSGLQEVSSYSDNVDGSMIISSQDSCTTPAIIQPLRSRQNREDDFDLDLEEIMVMEAIWLSIQETGSHRNPARGDTSPSESYITEDRYVSPGTIPLTDTTASPSGGLACAIASLAERQHMNGDSSVPDSNRLASEEEEEEEGEEEEVTEENYPPENWIEVSPDTGTVLSREEEGEWGIDHGSMVAEAGTSYASSDGTEEVGGVSEGVGDGFQANVMGPILPENFEEQMMLAMAVSLAEARARTSPQGVTWL